ncbi:MAG: hypothetical protein AB9907_08260 [Flexilinea sp.]
MSFSEGVNIIAGTNGTCKSTILHLVSNSFQAVDTKCDWITDKNCVKVLRSVNSSINPKMEALTKGDRQYNDPAIGTKGVLFTVNYDDGSSLRFRRHNTRKNDKNRFAVKPIYRKGRKERLPKFPVIYLGLTRLFPFPEYTNESDIKNIKIGLPEKYEEKRTNFLKSLQT